MFKRGDVVRLVDLTQYHARYDLHVGDVGVVIENSYKCRGDYDKMVDIAFFKNGSVITGTYARRYELIHEEG